MKIKSTDCNFHTLKSLFSAVKFTIFGGRLVPASGAPAVYGRLTIVYFILFHTFKRIEKC